MTTKQRRKIPYRSKSAKCLITMVNKKASLAKGNEMEDES